MEVTYQLATALACAAGLLTLAALVRQALRASSAPAWFPSVVVVYGPAVVLTLGFAGSLYYLGFALQAVMPGILAFAGTFVIHIAMVALLVKLLPNDVAHDGVRSVPDDALQARAAAS